jgi:hypothetical protein
VDALSVLILLLLFAGSLALVAGLERLGEGT